MPWIYNQSTGELFRPEGSLAGKGYAGKGEGRNNPALDHVRNVGPLPRGTYTIGQGIPKHPLLGRLAIPLTPSPKNKMHGRSHFYMHGDNKAHDASLGCPIQGPKVREEVNSSPDKMLIVIAAIT